MNKIAIIGAGIMGSGVAQRLLMSGYGVDLIDISEEIALNSIKQISLNLIDAESRGIIDSRSAKIFSKNIKAIDSIHKISEDTDLIIEAATENFENKVKIFDTLNQIKIKHCIVATNTSCLSVNRLAETIHNKSNFIGMHFFYPAERNKFLEIIPCKETSPETIYKIKILAEKMDKVSIICTDSPGFCVNRFFVPFLNEVVRLIENPANNIYQVNYCAKQAFKSALGPIDIMNLTGTALAYHTNKELADNLGDVYKPSKLLEAMAQSNDKWNLPKSSPENDQKYLKNQSNDEIILHLRNFVLSLALKLVKEKVCSTSEINLSSKIALGWKIGVFDLLETAIKTKSLEEEKLLSTIKIRSTRLTFNKNIATIELLRADKLNAINENLIKDLSDSLDACLLNQNTDYIVIKGYPKVFSAGADIKFFLENLTNRNFEAIMNFTQKAHQLLFKIHTSKKPVIAFIDGIAYGGGLELALSCHKIIATKRSTFHFPEVSIGLIPGYGGTQNAPKRVGINLAKYLILLSKKIDAQEALKFNLIDRIIDSNSDFKEFLEHTILLNQPNKNNFTDIDNEITSKVALLEKYIANKSIEKIKEIFEIEETSIIALDIANKLIEIGNSSSFIEGLSIEISYIKEIFNQPSLKQRLENIFKK